MIKLILSAPVPAMAAAFELYFQNTENVEIIRGPFETVPEFDCMVSAANSFGLMDGGVDAAITTYFGTQLQERVQQHILREYLGEQPVGTAFVTGTGNSKHPWLVHAPTMRVPLIIDGTDAVYNATRAALLAIFQHNKSAREDRKITSVVFPAMGAGCGQVSPDSVARQMRLAWNSFSNPPKAINWQYVSVRQNAVFSTTAYCPSQMVARTPERNISVLVITVRIAKNQVTAASVPVIRLMIFISAHTRTPQISVRTTTPFIQVHMRILTPFPLILILTAIT